MKQLRIINQTTSTILQRSQKNIALAPVDIVNELVGEYNTMDPKIRHQMIKHLIIHLMAVHNQL